MVAREGSVLTWDRAERLNPGDYAYFLVPTERAPRLDRLFAASETIHTHHPVAAFTFEAGVTLAELETAYGLSVPEDLRGYTVAEAFRLRNEDRVNIGDRIQLGPAALTVIELEGDSVRTVSLEIDEVELPTPSADRLFSDWLRRRIDSVIARLGT
jgi:NhaP-type Na+/H+ and K+/H+ antiporter